MNDEERPDVYNWVKTSGGRHQFLGLVLMAFLGVIAYVAFGLGGGSED